MAQPGDFAYTVKTSVDIVRVIGEYVRLKRRSGSNYLGLCPFHQEKTPSFNVSGQYQSYHCFGCGVHGDVFKFVQEMDRLTFPEAVRAVAEKNGIAVPKRTSPDSDPQARLRAQIFELHERAAEFYRKSLEGPEGSAARQYLNRRGISPDLVREFGLGYAPANGQALLRTLGSISEEAATGSSLIGRREDGSGSYDYFRNRLMFPIQNEAGKIIAFGARALRDEDQPKYLNSRESPIYRKSRVLYNWHRARDAMRKQSLIVLVEGYMDAIGVFSAGVPNVVASCGTSLTLEHVKNIAPMVKTVVVNYDPDSAGVKATERSLETLLEEKLEVRVLSLPDALDPDEFVKANGAAAYRDLLQQAPPFFDYLVDRVPSMFDLSQPKGKAEAARHLLSYVTKLPDRIVRVEMASRLSDRLGLDRDLLGKELRAAAAERRDAPRLGRVDHAGASHVETALVRLMLNSPEARQRYLHPLAALLASAPALVNLASRPILETLSVMFSEESGNDPADPVDVAALQDRLLPAQQKVLAEALHNDAIEELSITQAVGYIQELARRPLQARVEELRGLIRQAEQSGDVSKALELLSEKKTLEQKLASDYLLDNQAGS
jgi:DNA primase